ncbi:MAG: RagB/SusD family nutrient uptake outer membrane protein [Cyclobacteriaceae bacterium]|nr:RagB/SusD family nutrient uptake outer membrane protein [Cyclobacteriaceae bacterium SS2]
MKYLIISTIILSTLFFSCEDDLDQLPLSTTTAENFYVTELDFEQARNATYSVALHGTNGDNYGYPNRVLNLSETRSDNLFATTVASRDWEGLNNFFTSSLTNNSLISEAFIVNYNAIYKANQLIEKIEEKGDQVFIDEHDMYVMDAEARFLRAFCYFDLVRYFGKVPLLDKTVSPEAATKIGRAPVSDIYDLIIADLEVAADSLPDQHDVIGRATKNWAKTLLGLVYMTRSSPTYGIEGPGMNSNEWQDAYNVLNEVATSGLHSFAPTYSEIFTTEGAANVENVMSIPYEGLNLGVGGSWIINTTSDQYMQHIGLTPDMGGIEERPVSVDFRTLFDDADARLAFGIVDTFTVASTGQRYDGYFSPDPIMIKFADASRYGTGGRTDWGVDFIVFRYTDVLMMMAECILNGATGSLDVDDLVNDVRERAGLARDAVGVTLEDLFVERRKEFFNEGKRWFDLYRSGDAVQIMNDWRVAEGASAIVNEVTANSLLYPIPESQMNVVPGLYTQNPGY